MPDTKKAGKKPIDYEGGLKIHNFRLCSELMPQIENFLIPK